MIVLCCAIRNFVKPSAVRAIQTAAISTQAHRLTSEGPYVQSFGNPAYEKLKGKEDDFLYFPDFFNEAEQEILLKLALWKLDRVDSSRRRRRRRSSPTDEGALAEKDGLQRMFEDTSAYGFEDVRGVVWFPLILLNYMPATSTGSLRLCHLQIQGIAHHRLPESLNNQRSILPINPEAHIRLATTIRRKRIGKKPILRQGLTRKIPVSINRLGSAIRAAFANFYTCSASSSRRRHPSARG